MLGTKIVQLVALTAFLTFTTASNDEFIEFQGRAQATLGSGINSSDLPIAKCGGDQSEESTCWIVTRDGNHCNITYLGEQLTILKSVHQFPGNKVLLHVRQYSNSRLLDENDKYMLTLVDMNNCTRVYDVSLPLGSGKVIPYEDGSYDVVQTVDRKKCCMKDLHLQHYDANGQVFGEPLDITMDLEQKDVDAVSPKSRSRGFYVQGRPTSFDLPSEFKLIATDGKSQVKDMMKLNSRYCLISHVDADKYYTVCGQNMQNAEKVVCKRLDLQTEQVFEAEYELNGQSRIRDVRASDSGIVAFGLQLDSKYQVEKFVLVEMRPDEQTITQKIDFPWNATVENNCQIRDFNGADLSFTLACEVRSPTKGVALHKFLLPNSA